MVAIFTRQGTVPGSVFGVTDADVHAEGEQTSEPISMEGFNQITLHLETTLVSGSSATGFQLIVEATEISAERVDSNTKWAVIPVETMATPPTIENADGIYSRLQSANTVEVWLRNLPCNYRTIRFKVDAVGTTADGDLATILYARKGVI